MNDYHEFPDSQHLYGYCVASTTLVDEHVEAGLDFRYHIVVIDKTSYIENSDSVIVTTYEFNMDQLVAFIRQSDDQFLSIERLTNNN